MTIYNEVLKAEKRIRKYIRKTPLEFSPNLSQFCHANVYLKLESEQLTGSFKIRGVFNKLLSSKDKLKNGFITASTGNHGHAIAYASKRFGLKGTVFVSESASKGKVEPMKLYDINIERRKGASGEVEIYARKTAKERGVPYISPYNDIDIIAGQGTVGVEIFDQLPTVDVIFSCIGGGGLISGIAGYIKEKNRGTRIIGCEPENSCQMSACIKAGKFVEVKHKSTLSEGSAGGMEPNSITLDFCKRHVDEFMQVTEEEIREAMVYMIEKHHKIIEGAAAVPLASLMKRKNEFKNQTVVIVISGCGVGIETIRKALCR